MNVESVRAHALIRALADPTLGDRVAVTEWLAGLDLQKFGELLKVVEAMTPGSRVRFLLRLYTEGWGR